MRHALSRALLALLLLAPFARGEETPPVRVAAPLPALADGWSVETKNMGWDPQGVYVRLFTRGNCRIEEQEICYPAPGGGTVCRTVPKEVCDEGIEKLRFDPAVVTVHEKWLYWLRDDGEPVVFGKGFRTFPYWNVVLFHGARLVFEPDAEEPFVGVELNLDTLGQSKRVQFFQELFPIRP